MPEKKQDRPVRIPKNYYDKSYFTIRGKKGLYDESSFAKNNLFHKKVAGLIAEVLLVEKGKKLLEIGCALGNVIYHLNNVGLDACGIDLSDYAIANSHTPDKIKQGDVIDKIPFEDKTFDYVFSRETLEHIDGFYIPVILRDIYRVTKIGGTGLFSPANNTYDKETKKQENGNPCNDESHLCVKPPYWWAEKFEEAGFAVDYKRSMFASSLSMPDKFAWTMIVVRREK